jgi:nucleoid-associated protein YgaU
MLSGAALLALPPTAAFAEGVRGVSPDGKRGWLHTVERGDTLWDITAKYLGTPWIWPSIWKENADIPNPHRIDPGDRIWITETEIRKLTEAEVAAILTGAGTDSAGEVPANQDAMPPAPPAPRAAVDPRAGDPFAALDRTGRDQRTLVAYPGLHRMGFITPADQAGSAAILGSHDENYWSSQERRTIIGIGEGRVHIGDRFTVFRTRRRVDHPETGVPMGYLVDRLGTAEVTEIHPESSFVRIASSYSEIEPGDRVTPYKPEPNEFVTEHRQGGPSGVVVSVPIHRQYALNGDVIIIDRGSEDGVATGHEFQLYRAGKEVRDPVTTTKTLVPDDVLGELMVLTTNPTTSLALLVRARREIAVGDHYRPM